MDCRLEQAKRNREPKYPDSGEGTSKIKSTQMTTAYRYRLDRRWAGGEGLCGFIMLNPSTADEQADDPTIRRCIGFAKGWGYSGLIVGNLFALRATDPTMLLAARDPVGGRTNARALVDLIDEASLIVCAWGHFTGAGQRGKEAIALIRARGRLPYCLGLTRQGAPRHPLRLPASMQPVIIESPLNFPTASTLTQSSIGFERHPCSMVKERQKHCTPATKEEIS